MEAADSLVVELVGARGVGKSTLAKLLKSELRERGLATRPALADGLGAKIARHSSTLADRARFVCTTLTWRPRSARDLRTFRKRYRRLRVGAAAKRSIPGVDLVDEGVFQLIMELQAKTAQKDVYAIARRMAGLVPFPDLVVLVEGSDEAIEARRLRRANAGDLLRPRVATWERVALERTKALLGDMEARGVGPEVLVVRNGDQASLQRSASRVAAHLAMRWSQRSKTTAAPRRTVLEAGPAMTLPNGGPTVGRR